MWHPCVFSSFTFVQCGFPKVRQASHQILMFIRHFGCCTCHWCCVHVRIGERIGFFVLPRLPPVANELCTWS